MYKMINDIMNEQLHRYWIELYLVSGVRVNVNCCECFFAFDPETLELEIHTEEDRKYLDNPILSIKQEDIVSWE